MSEVQPNWSTVKVDKQTSNKMVLIDKSKPFFSIQDKIKMVSFKFEQPIDKLSQ